MLSILPSLPTLTHSMTTTATMPISNTTHTTDSSNHTKIDTKIFASSGIGLNQNHQNLAIHRLTEAGFLLRNPEVVNRRFLRFAGTDKQRASDLQNIATYGETPPQLLLANRGGYGAMRILPMIDWDALGHILKEYGTILSGYSDVTAIQCALLAKANMTSLAAPMLYSDFGKPNPSQFTAINFVNALTNPNLQITTTIEPTSNLPPIPQKNMEGIIWGGNLSMISSLADSDYLPKFKGGILFLEDIGESVYHIERMLYHLLLTGVLSRQQAIILGAFSNIKADGYDSRYDLKEVIEQLSNATKLPIFHGFRFGHIHDKVSFPLGVNCTIQADNAHEYTLNFDNYPTIPPSIKHKV